MDDQRPLFETHEDQSVISGYRVLSPRAVAACVIGVASLLAFVSPIFWLLPLVGIALSGLSLRYLDQNRDRFFGIGWAWTGLFLSLFSLAGAPTRQYVRMSTMENRARVLADQFVRLVNEGRLNEAHQCHLRSADRAAIDVDLRTYYSSHSEQAAKRDTFFDGDVLKQWLALTGPLDARFVRVSSSFALTEQEEILFEYIITGKRDNVTFELPLFIVISREKIGGSSQFEMFVGGVTDLDPFLRRSL